MEAQKRGKEKNNSFLLFYQRGSIVLQLAALVMLSDKLTKCIARIGIRHHMRLLKLLTFSQIVPFCDYVKKIQSINHRKAIYNVYNHRWSFCKRI